MARWMVLYRDEDGGPMVAVVEDRDGASLPYGGSASAVIRELPNYNDGGGSFLVELPDEGDAPMVVDTGLDEEVSRTFITI